MIFLIELTYVKGIEDVEQHLADHVQFLDKFYSSGNFLLSGRKVPRTGGVIMAKFENEEDVYKAIDEDPFHKNDIATYKVIAIQPTKCASALEATFMN